MQTTESTQLDILRHGEHVLGDVVCGVTDPVLSEKGWKQLNTQSQRLQNLGQSWDVVITSPRKRCSIFAQKMANKLGVNCIEDTDFGEVNFGIWEALSFSQINDRYPGKWQEWTQNSSEAAPHGGEIYDEFLDRVKASTDNIFEKFRGQKILLVAHGGVIRALLFHVLQLPSSSLSRFHVPHACHSRIIAYHHQGEKDWFQLDKHNTADV